MDTKEEMLEEIENIEEVKNEAIIEDAAVPVLEDINVESSIEEMPAIEENVIDENTNASTEQNKEDETTTEEKKKSKTPLIVLLSVLLVLDIIALVIYIIGIEKVISFIK